jgi:Uncharacterized protein conserved in bacteria
MKLIPLIKVKNIQQAVYFYTEVLDFKLKYPEEALNIYAVNLMNGDAEFQLSEVDGIFGVAVNVYVDELDQLFKKYKSRGLLVAAGKEQSPVHQGPLNQTWGRREFYVTDADGNTLRFSTPITDR